MSGMEDSLYRIVLTGLLISVTLYGLGIIAFVFSPEGESWRLLMEAGTILLLFTPIVKVTVAGYMFKNRGEKANAATALLVLIFMLLSLVLGIFLRIK